MIHVREHSARLLKEKSSEQLHGNTDIIPSHLHLFTAADLSLPYHRVPLFKPCARAPVINIRMRWRKIFEVEQYSSNKFSDECHPKIFPLQKKANYGTTH